MFPQLGIKMLSQIRCHHFLKHMQSYRTLQCRSCLSPQAVRPRSLLCQPAAFQVAQLHVESLQVASNAADNDIPQDLGVHAIQLREQKVFDSLPYPLALSPTKDNSSKDIHYWADWTRDNTSLLKELLLKYGTIFFRGFPVPGVPDFDVFVKAFGYESLPYIGGAAVRYNVEGGVFTANDAPGDRPVPFHHEMAQVVDYPKVIFFYCSIAASVGGQTSTILSNVVYREMLKREPEFTNRLEKEGIHYKRVLPDGDDPTSPIGRGWQSTYLTEDKAEAERRATEQNNEFEWLPNGCMVNKSKICEAIKVDQRNGKKMWFNLINDAYRSWFDDRNVAKEAIYFPNGDYMDAKVMATLEAVLDENKVSITWQPGDVMMIDNRQALHAREYFEGERKILACLLKD